MQLDCPHCQNPIPIAADAPPDDLLCPACGSSIRLDSSRTRTFTAAAPRRLGKFELLETIGVGSFGTVYKARDTELDRIVALKIPRAADFASQDDADRFLREARSAAQIKHPAIVSVHDARQSDGT